MSFNIVFVWLFITDWSHPLCVQSDYRICPEQLKWARAQSHVSLCPYHSVLHI